MRRDLAQAASVELARSQDAAGQQEEDQAADKTTQAGFSLVIEEKTLTALPVPLSYRASLTAIR